MLLKVKFWKYSFAGITKMYLQKSMRHNQLLQPLPFAPGIHTFADF